MNVQLVNSLVELVLTLSPEEQKLFQENLSNKHLKLLTSKPQTSAERLLLWQKWLDTAPTSYANISNEALRRDNIYDDEVMKYDSIDLYFFQLTIASSPALAARPEQESLYIQQFSLNSDIST